MTLLDPADRKFFNPQPRPEGQFPDPVDPTTNRADIALTGQARITDENRQRAANRIAFQLGLRLPGANWSTAVPVLADKFVEVSGGNPAFFSALDSDINSLWALTDTQIADKIAHGEPVGTLDPVVDSVAEILFEVGAKEEATRWVAQSQASLRTNFDALEYTQASDVMAGIAGRETPTLALGAGPSTIGLLKTFDEPGAWSYDSNANLVALTVGDRTIGFQPRTGFKPYTTTDVITEAVVAMTRGDQVGSLSEDKGILRGILDVVNKAGSWVDSHPTVQQTTNDFFAAARLVTPLSAFTVDDWLAYWKGDGPSPLDLPGPLTQAQAGIDEQANQIQADAYHQAQTLRFPEEAVIAEMGLDIIKLAEAQGVTVPDPLSLAADLVDEDKDRILSTWQSLNQEQFITELQTQLEGQSTLGGALNTSLQTAMNLMESYDAVVQWIGIQAIHRSGVGPIISALTDDEGQNPFEVFKAASDAAYTDPEAANVAEYFGLEGSAADTALLAVGIGFDPLNLFFPGAKGQRALFIKAMEEPEKYGLHYLSNPAVRHITEGIAAGGDDAIRKVMYLEMGSDGAGYTRRLFDLALDPASTPEMVNDVLFDAMKNGTFLGAGPNRAVRMATTQNLARAADNLFELKPHQQQLLFDLTTEMSRSRIIDLGENRGIDEFFDFALQLHADQPAVAQSWAMKALDAVSPATTTSEKGALALQGEKLNKKLAALKAQQSSLLGARDPVGMRANRDLLSDALKNVDTLGLDDTARQALTSDMNTQLSQINANITRTDEHLRTIRSEMAKVNTQLGQMARLEGDLFSPENQSRANLARVFHEFFDDIAVQINTEAGQDLIPLTGEFYDLAPDIPVRDWEKVTGAPRSGRYGLTLSDPSTRLKSINMTDGFALNTVGELDKTMSRQLSALNFFPRIQHVSLPASPYEITLFRRIASQPDMLAKWINHARTSRLQTLTSKVRTLFGFNLLINGITPIKTGIDETTRFYALTGALGRTLKATAAGVPGVQSVTRKIGELPGFRRFMTDAGEFVTNPFAREHARHFDQEAKAWAWINPKTEGVTGEQFRNSAERWVNGTLVENSPAFRAYARSTAFDASQREIGEEILPDEFIAWWEKEGQFLAKTDEFTMSAANGGSKVPVDARFAYRTTHEAFNNWIRNNVAEGAQNKMRRRLLEYAKGNAERLDIVNDADLLMRIKNVPAPRPQTSKGWWNTVVGKSFDFAFGSPTARRAGVFHEYFFDEAANTFAKRFGGAYENGRIVGKPGGRILTAQMIADTSDVPLEVAQHMMAQGSANPVVRDMVEKRGLKLGTQLEAQAAAYASKRANDLMYRYTAATLVGQGVEAGLMFPYARAQMDFLSWWAKHLTTPQQIGLNIPFTKFAMSTRQPYQLPLNLRAWSKYGHMVATTNNEYEDTVVDNALKKLTFFPFRFDDEFLMDILPQPGPIPSWMFDLGVESGWIGEDLQKEFLSAFPTLAFDENTGDPIKDLYNGILPSGGRSLRGLLTSSARSVAALGGMDIDSSSSWLGQLYQFLASNQTPRALNDMLVADYSDWLNENAFGGIGPGGEEWLKATDELALGSALKVNKMDGVNAVINRITPLAGNDGEARDLKSYEGLFTPEIFSDLETFGVLAANETFDVDGVPRIKAVYEKWQNGEADREDITFLSNALHRIYGATQDVELIPGSGFTLMDYIHLTHPGIAPNRVSKSQCSGGAPSSDAQRAFRAEHCDPDTGKLQNIADDQTGLDLIRDARTRGWIINRPPDGLDGWMYDTHRVLYQSAKNAIDAVWYVATRGYQGVGQDGYDPSQGREWTGTSTKAFDKATVTTGPIMERLLKPLGFDLPQGTTMTGADFFDMLANLRDQYAIPYGNTALMEGEMGRGLARDPVGKQVRDAIETATRTQSKNGLSISDWPEGLKDAVRSDITKMIDQGVVSVDDYHREWESYFGPLDYQPPVPPSVDELGQKEGTSGVRITRDEISNGELAVVDGDTVSILLSDGPTRVRLYGINSPEIGQDGYSQATQNLQQVIDAADEVVIGFFDTPTLGLVQTSAPGERRLIGWLYVNGVPIYDPSVFTADNPRGAGLGGNVIDLMAILNAR